MEPVLVVLFGLVIAPLVFLMIFLIVYNRRQNKVLTETQRTITDRDIIRLISTEPDGLLSKRQLAEKTGLSRSEAGIRLQQLQLFGVLQVHYGKNFKPYYGLLEPIDDRPAPELSPEPFLTVEDILSLFQHFDNRISPQQLIMATGLPLNIIKRELKYFEKQGIIQALTTQSSPYGGAGRRTYVLKEPYRSNPDRFREQQLDLNREMKTILMREDLV